MNNGMYYGYEVTVEKNKVLDQLNDDETWEVKYTMNLNPILQTKTVFPNTACKFKLEAGDTAYAVWAVWSVGDQNRIAVNSESKVYGLFKSHEVAKELLDVLTQATNDSSQLRVCNTSDGQEFSFAGTLPWTESSNRLEELVIKELSVTESI